MTTTTDLSKFGFREIKMVADLLNAWIQHGLPTDFENNEVVPMMNYQSGAVFLTNSEFQAAMMNGDKLEVFYSSPYEGKEGFFYELIDEYKEMHPEDQEWFQSIAESLNKKLPELA
jgi:hypothetical protein